MAVEAPFNVQEHNSGPRRRTPEIVVEPSRVNSHKQFNGGTWTVQAAVGGAQSTFYLNLCDGVQSYEGADSCAADSSSCVKQGSEYINIGHRNDTLQPVSNLDTGGFRLDYLGGSCGTSSKTWRTTIDFKCGTTLGSPTFLEKTDCAYLFEWYTTVACKMVRSAAVSEVPCSVYDLKGKKRDLSPLIKLQGGYLVESAGSDDLYINVCRDITPDSGPTLGCSSGSAACLTKQGTFVDMGQALQPLRLLSDDELQLQYQGREVQDECGGFNSTVTIVFVCPREQGRYTGNRGPILLSKTNCQYQVQWQTEYACEAELLSTDTCAFNKPTHGLELDLSPLTKTREISYYVGNDPHYIFYLNVCANLTFPIACQSAAVCQVDKDGSSPKSAGVEYKHELRYSDGELTLIYKHGQTCNHNGFQRTSIISFHCNETQDPGNPVYVTETECTYFFDWHTKVACVPDLVRASCRLDQGKRRYDLSPLIRETGSNWLVLDGRHDHGELRSAEYYINVCADIMKENLANLDSCPSPSSSCALETDQSGQQTGKSLGRFLASPTFTNGYITMTYTDGSVCSGSRRTTTDITFICSPGDLESAPILVRKSSDSCQYDLEWHTAAACPLAQKWGTDCKVFDDDAGVSFDLSPLTKEGGYYNITAGGYDYYINVCGNIRGTPCNRVGHLPNPGACQSRRDGSGESYDLGITNRSLGYFDGIIKLTYLGGTPYHSEKVTHRMTEIAFLCDPKEDVGSPQFFQENEATYFFRWYTKHACPQQPIECVVTDEAKHEQYDLSSLSKALEEENWSFVDDRDPANRKKYYINVCRPINPYMQCGSFAGVCQTSFENNQESVSVANLGVPSSPPTIERSGHLLLTYENGSDCGNGQRVTSRIHFACNKGILASTPRLLEVVESCTYSFLWETEAACAIGVSEGENCTVRDVNSDYTFNLQPLQKEGGYEVTGTDGASYQINICGAAPSCPKNSGACLLSETSHDSLGTASSSLAFSDEGLLTLEYNLGHFYPARGRLATTVISFLCRRNASQTEPQPTFVRQEGERFIFQVETPLACLPESVDCLVSDAHGNQYDLSPLAKDTGNWEAVDTRPGFDTLSYHINICRPVNKGDTTASSCPGGPIGACQTSPNSGDTFNLGYVQAMPEAAVDGSLSIRYVNGDICHGKYHRSTRINFECSDTPGSPVFQTETPECEYIFSWETPAACPLQRVVGGNCSVQVPEFGYEFNLSTLYSKTQDYTVTTSEYTYNINVCGPLVSGQGDCAGGTVGGCQKMADGTFKNAGLFNKNLTYSNGVLKLNYTQGSTCHTVYQRSTAINFYCDENVEGIGSPHYIQESADCTYIFEWATPLACPPFKVVECSYREGGQQYDLAPLSKLTDNYRVQGVATTGTAYYINVCRSLWHRHGAQGEFCPHNAAACLETTDSAGKKSYISLGEVDQGPTVENGHLVLRYTSGQACPDGSGRKRSTVINIQCDKNSMVSEPSFDHVDGNCEYHFLWLTSYACDITDNIKPTGDCTTTNPISGFRFDFTSLKKEDGYTVMGSDGHKYVLNICNPLGQTNCEGQDVGSCQEEISTTGRNFNAGIFNRNLYFDDSILFLRYDNGKECHNNQYQRSSVINFVCPHRSDALGEPVFIAESDDCTYYFSWHTSLACEKFIQCSVMNGSEAINLAPLINDQGYHLATNLNGDGSVTYINLCRPLNPIPGLTCHPNSAACQVKGGNAVSLGRVSEEPKIGSDGRLTITYTQGDRCPQDSSRNISSIITFFCRQGITQGSPTLEGDISDCTYHFTWGTNVVCPAAAPETDTDCTFFNSALQYTFDFTSLSAQEQTVVASSAKTMKLKLCGLSSDQAGECSGAAICLQAGQDRFSLGQQSTQRISQEGELIRVEYSGGSPCPHTTGEKRQSTVLMVCDRNAVNTSPTLFTSDLDCHYSFRWITRAACAPETRPCDIAFEDHVYDLKPLSRITGSFHFHDSNKNEYYMNLCQPAYDTPEGCSAQAGMCRQSPDGQVNVLGMEYTQQLTTSGNTPDLVVTFGEGEKVSDCDGSGTPTTGSTVKITFKCANKIGNPVFVGSKVVEGKCEFSFEWKSTVACKEERVPVNMKDMKITDPETNVVMDFSPIMKQAMWQAEGDSRLEASGTQSSYVYFITMDKALPSNLTQTCADAAICQTKKSDKNFFRDVGMRSTRKYYAEDELIEMVVTKPNSCGKDNADTVISTVIFQCETDRGTGAPEFYYESSNCQYTFLWLTSVVCIEGKVVIPGDDGGSHDIVDAKHQKASIIFAVLLVIIFLCILAIVFHKRERRSALYWRLRCCCPGAYSKVPTYSYSQLSNGDAEELVEGGAQSRSLLGFGGEEDEELLKDTRRNPFEFHDDSDDEILPHV
ncbi:cation-independent mannose-6-phosphate receptor-like [Diadema setosum]|uniref:cation-independent mannose-6-phosphate receptor-like n=1 Tax=Diadema setosum TaxID=31175 RepID=UPI003B3B16C7